MATVAESDAESTVARAKDASDAESDMVMHKRVGVRSLHKRRGV